MIVAHSGNATILMFSIRPFFSYGMFIILVVRLHHLGTMNAKFCAYPSSEIVNTG